MKQTLKRKLTMNAFRFTAALLLLFSVICQARADKVIATTTTNKPLIDVAKAQGWIASDATQMTDTEAAAVSDIGTAFKGNTSITSFDEFQYFTNVTTMNNSPFYGCTALTSIILPSGLTEICREAFRGCSALTSITLPSGITTINSYSFYDCTSLASITLPDALTTIQSSAFGNCTALTEFTFPIGVTYVANQSPFVGCTNLTKFTFNCPKIGSWLDGNTTVKEIKIGQDVTTIGIVAFRGCTGLTTVSIPDNVTSIEAQVFQNCTGLTSVLLSNAITEIPTSMFSGCTALPSIILPSGITTIKSNAFHDCTSLASITLPETLSSIGANAFKNCTSLTEITIPSGVTSIYGSNQGSFTDCTNLTKFTFLCPKIESSWIQDNAVVKEIIFGEGVTTIANFAFKGCTSLVNVTIPDNVTSMGSGVFEECTGLTSVTLSNAITSISRMFVGCTALTSVTLPNELTEIGQYSFENCTSLPSITLPNTLTTIGVGAFNYCIALTELTIPSNVTSIYSKNRSFEGCTNLTSFTFNCTKIGSWLDGNTTVKEIIIGQNVTTIGTTAFKGCSSLTSVTIGDGIESIGSQAFASCSELKDVYCYAINVPNTSTNTFEDSSVENATLHVPAESVDAYKDAEPWKNFGTIQDVDIKVELSKTKAIIEKGKTVTLKAKVTPSTLTDKSVTWKSSNKKVATVTSAGKVKGVGAGTATITCTSNATGAKATCEVLVGYVKLSDTEVAIEKGKIVKLKSKVYPSTVKDQSVRWESSDPTIVKVGSTGKIKGMKVGKATITCTSNATGLKATCEVTVGYVKLSKTELTIEKGKIVKLKYKVYPTSEDQGVTWKTSDPTVVKVASSGQIKGMKVGTSTITCISNATGLSATCEVTVVKASSAPSLNGTDEDVTGIDEKPALAEEFDVYDLNGRRVLDKATSLDGLSNGVYIVNGKKVVKK